jgi:hypothetical protein
MASLSARPSILILIRCPTLKLTFPHPPVSLFSFVFFCVIVGLSPTGSSSQLSDL